MYFNTVIEITLLFALVLFQPEVSRCMKTTASDIGIPVEVTGCRGQPMIALETQNLSW